MGVVAAIAAVGSTVVAVTSANNQRKVQERALEDQRQANERAEQRAKAEQQRTEHKKEQAKIGAKTANLTAKVDKLLKSGAGAILEQSNFFCDFKLLTSFL